MIGQFSIRNNDNFYLEKFKKTLRIYQYTHDQFLQFRINPFAYDQYDLPIFAYRHRLSTPFGILFHLFFLGRKLKLDNIRKIFSEAEIDELLTIKIFEKVAANSLQSSVLILPYQEYLFVCDFILQLEDRPSLKEYKLDLIYPINLDSITLSEASIKRPVDSVLDLGCGSGFLSIIASRHSKHVVGIDINPRAINFSSFNALLNNISNCQFICGDLYAPIKGKKFDLIISNPPYEIALDKTNLFQGGGRDGRAVLRRIIKGAPLHLADEGFCQIITKIAEFPNGSKKQTLQQWLKHEKYHLFFLELYKMDREQAAFSLAKDVFLYKKQTMIYKRFSEHITRILQHFDRMHLSHITFGLITLTKANHFKYTEKIFASKNVLATELSAILQKVIYKHFILSLGIFALFYFLKNLLYSFPRKILANFKL